MTVPAFRGALLASIALVPAPLLAQEAMGGDDPVTTTTIAAAGAVPFLFHDLHAVFIIIRREFRSNWGSKLLGQLVIPLWRRVENRINPSGYNGAAFVGLRGVVVKSHGNADAFEFSQAIFSARRYVDRELPKEIEKQLN